MTIIECWNLSISQNVHLHMSIMKILRDQYANGTENINVLYMLIWYLVIVFKAV